MTWRLFLVVVCCALPGCRDKENEGPIVSVSLKNTSSYELTRVKLEWDGPYVPGGIIGPGMEKTALGVRWPASPVARVRFFERRSGETHTIEVSFEDLSDAVEAGRCSRIVIEISALDSGAARCH